MSLTPWPLTPLGACVLVTVQEFKAELYSHGSQKAAYLPPGRESGRNIMKDASHKQMSDEKPNHQTTHVGMRLELSIVV